MLMIVIILVIKNIFIDAIDTHTHTRSVENPAASAKAYLNNKDCQLNRNIDSNTVSSNIHERPHDRSNKHIRHHRSQRHHTTHRIHRSMGK